VYEDVKPSYDRLYVADTLIISMEEGHAGDIPGKSGRSNKDITS